MSRPNEPEVWRNRGEFRGGERGTAVISGVTFSRTSVTFSNVDGLAIFEGDIALGPVEQLEAAMTGLRDVAAAGADPSRSVAIAGERYRWPNGEVPYVIDPDLPDKQRVLDAIAHWEANTPIVFPERTAANAAGYDNYVYFASEGGCWSYVGMQGTGAQTISLGAGCTTGNAVHEIGHAVGLWHEQSREDRELFVTIRWENIQDGMAHNFDQHISDGDDIGVYDYASIMHYPRTAFSKNGRDTITPVDRAARIGQRDGLSPGDIAAVMVMYSRVQPSQPYTTDLTGDGRADVAGFGDRGLWTALSNGNGTFQPMRKVIDNFAYSAGGWRVERHPRMFADLTGDGRADVVGFGERGVWVSLNNGDGTFGPLRMAVANFAYDAGGWRVERHPRYLADLTGDGRADIVGFGDGGVWVSLNNGDGTFGPLRMAVANFGFTAGGWRVSKHPRFVADLTGDGRADLAGFGEAGLWVSLNNGDGTFQAPRLAIGNFGFTAGGWRVGRHPRHLADLTGDGCADIVGFGDAGVWVALNKGDGTFQAPQLAVNNFGYGAGGWRVDKHPRCLADLTGDGRADIVGFGDQGVWVALNNGNGTFQPMQMPIGNFAYEVGGWRVGTHPRFVADITGDQQADVVGFGESGVWVSLNSGKGGSFSPLQMPIANFGHTAGGWQVDKHPRFVVGPR